MVISARTQLLIGIVLAILLVVTRSQHFASLHHLPSASWAVFILAGIYLPEWALTALLALVFAVDFPSFLTGNNEVCFTQAYVMLLPAYVVLWMGGRWYAKHHSFSLNSLFYLMGAVVIATFGAELISSGGYYYLSGQFTPTLSEFMGRIAEFYPYFLASTAFYIALAGFVHSLSVAIQHINDQRRIEHG